MSKILPKGAPIQHGALLVMDEDGGNAKIINVGGLSGDRAISKAKDLLRAGLNRRDDADKNGIELIRRGARIINEGKEPATMYYQELGNALKGKDDRDIARFMADYGKANDMGGLAELFEGKKGVNVSLVMPFMEELYKRCHGDYSVIPGAFNCGTSARGGFDSVQGGWSHFLDLLWGGFPSNNSPSLSSKTTAKSYDKEDRGNMVNGRTFWSQDMDKL